MNGQISLDHLKISLEGVIMSEVIVACDFPNKEKLLNFVDLFNEEKPYNSRRERMS